MMEERCRDIQKLIPELLAGTLPDEKASALRGHVSRCPACRRYLQALQGDDRLFSDFVETMQPTVARIQDRLMESLGEELRKGPVRYGSAWETPIKRPSVQLTIAASVILLFLLFSVPFLIRNKNTGLETSPRYILAETQKGDLKETRPWDILPPLPE